MKPESNLKNCYSSTSVVNLGAEHVPELSQLNAWLLEDEGHDMSVRPAELAVRMRTWLKSSYRAYGIIDTNQIVAYALCRDDADCLYLRQLFTRRKCRGRGCGSALLEYIEEKIALNKPVRLDVLASNQSAKLFYEKRGFALDYYSLVKPKNK